MMAHKQVRYGFPVIQIVLVVCLLAGLVIGAGACSQSNRSPASNPVSSDTGPAKTTGSSLADETSQVPSPPPASPMSVVQVTLADAYVIDQGNMQANIATITLSGLADPVEQDRLNSQLHSQAESLIASFEKNRALLLESKPDDDPYLTVQLGFSILSETDQTLSIRIVAVDSSGTANSWVQYLTFDRVTGASVTLSSYFGQETNYRHVISAYLLDLMRQKNKVEPQTYWIDGSPEESFVAIDADQSFYLNQQKDLVICFQKYELGPGSLGNPEFVIPTDVLARIEALYQTGDTLDGLTWLVIGDSISEHNAHADRHYDEYIQDWSACQPINVAKAATGYATAYLNSPAWLDQLADYPPAVDFITISGSSNDWDYPLGQPTDTSRATFYGVLDQFFLQLQVKYPGVPILVLTALPRDDGYGNSGPGAGHVDAVIDVAGRYQLPVLDLYRLSMLRPWVDTDNRRYFGSADHPTGDGVHPNSDGQLILAQQIYPALLDLLD